MRTFHGLLVAAVAAILLPACDRSKGNGGTAPPGAATAPAGAAAEGPVSLMRLFTQEREPKGGSAGAKVRRLVPGSGRSTWPSQSRRIEGHATRCAVETRVQRAI